ISHAPPVQSPNFSMPPLDLKPKSPSDVDYRKAALSLRWLLIILASYLSVFTYLGTELFQYVFALALAFAASNVVLMLIPRRHFRAALVQRATAILDLLFVSAILFLLRVPENYLYLAFLMIFVLAVIWRDLRIVLFSVFAVSVLFGAFTYFRFFQFHLDIKIAQFLTLSLFFVVSIFYLFLSHWLTQDDAQ